eukprot:129556-Rhodomonas_salina.2
MTKQKLSIHLRPRPRPPPQITGIRTRTAQELETLLEQNRRSEHSKEGGSTKPVESTLLHPRTGRKLERKEGPGWNASVLQ